MSSYPGVQWTNIAKASFLNWTHGNYQCFLPMHKSQSLIGV